MNLLKWIALLVLFTQPLTSHLLSKQPKQYNKAKHQQKKIDYLAERLETNDARYHSFLLALELLTIRQARTLIETGTARFGNTNFIGDGGSTIIFGHWAHENKASLTTVDIDPQAVETARQATLKYKDSTTYVCSDSIDFLNNVQHPIDFLYLDSFDFEFDNPSPSQEHHLKEIEAAYSKLHENSIVMIDDCDLPFGGKGRLVTEYLLERNWIILFAGYQTIFVRP